jgi:Na+-transporting NADH:ubiquinone oxidoreductase subunit NqrA
MAAVTAVQITTRKELHGFIDAIDDEKLAIVHPLLSYLAMNESLIVETDLTDEERAIVDEGVKEYKEHPETFEQ